MTGASAAGRAKGDRHSPTTKRRSTSSLCSACFEEVFIRTSLYRHSEGVRSSSRRVDTALSVYAIMLARTHGRGGGREHGGSDDRATRFKNLFQRPPSDSERIGIRLTGISQGRR